MVVLFYAFLGISITVCGNKIIKTSIWECWFLILVLLAVLVVWLVMMRKPTPFAREGGKSIYKLIAQFRQNMCQK
jgi:H+/Cl- antiporter ClcA